MTSLTEVAGGRGTCLFGISVALPGLTLLDSAAPYTSATGGHHRGLVLSWGSFDYRVSDRGGRLNAVESRIRINDADRTLLRIKDGARADEVRGSVVSVYLMAPGTASSGWDSIFVGTLTKLSFPEPFVAELTLRVNNQQLQRIRPDGWKLTRKAFPNASAAALDQYAPVLYGTHDASYTQTGPGLVPCACVDTLQFKYMVCAGKAKSVTRVYSDGVQVSGGSYSSGYSTIDGRSYTLITFTSDRGTQEITCDATGYESVGDGSGTLITNPATQWAHRLTNFCLGDYMTGAWLSTNALIDSTTLTAAETYFTSLGALGSDYDAEKRTGDDVVARFCNSWRMRCGWTFAGKIAVGWENLAASIYGGTRLRWYRDETGPFSLVDEDFTVTNRIVVNQAHSASQSKYLTSFSVVDASFSADTPDSLDLELSEAR